MRWSSVPSSCRRKLPGACCDVGGCDGPALEVLVLEVGIELAGLAFDSEKRGDPWRLAVGHGVAQLLQNIEDGEIPGRDRNNIAVIAVAEAVHVEHAVLDAAGQHEMRPAIEQ